MDDVEGPKSHAPAIHSRGDLAKLTVAALGVVYGDIGTSPLYALRECFTAPHGVAVTHDNVLGILSLVTWALILVVGAMNRPLGTVKIWLHRARAALAATLLERGLGFED